MAHARAVMITIFRTDVVIRTSITRRVLTTGRYPMTTVMTITDIVDAPLVTTAIIGLGNTDIDR